MPSNNKSCPEEVREYMRRIGAMGGRAQLGSETRKAIGRRIAKARWKAIRATGGESFAKPSRDHVVEKPKRYKRKLRKTKKISIRVPHFTEQPKPWTPEATTPQIGFK